MPYVPISQENILQFRVRYVGPNPAAMFGVDAVTLRIDYVSEQGSRGFPMPEYMLAPYFDALSEAQRSQAVYWVDLDYSATRHLGPQPEDDALHRIMKAVQDGQIVESEPAG